MRLRKVGWVALLLLCGTGAGAFAQEGAGAASSRGVDTLWVLVTAFLVFFMQAGFGMVEAGFIRAKNACNILTKNFLDYCVASIMFYLVGYALMFGHGSGFIGWTGFGMEGAPNPSGVDLLRASGSSRRPSAARRPPSSPAAWPSA